MSGIAYTRYELLRTFRNRRFFLFSLGLPLIFFWLITDLLYRRVSVFVSFPLATEVCRDGGFLL